MICFACTQGEPSADPEHQLKQTLLEVREHGESSAKTTGPDPKHADSIRGSPAAASGKREPVDENYLQVLLDAEGFGPPKFQVGPRRETMSCMHDIM